MDLGKLFRGLRAFITASTKHLRRRQARRPYQEPSVLRYGNLNELPPHLQTAAKALQRKNEATESPQRAEPRFPIAVWVASQREDGVEWQCRSLNISRHGLGLEAGMRLIPGERVQFQFQLPGAREQVRASGEVRWSDQRGRTGLYVSAVSPVHVLTSWIAGHT